MRAMLLRQVPDLLKAMMWSVEFMKQDTVISSTMFYLLFLEFAALGVENILFLLGVLASSPCRYCLYWLKIGGSVCD